MTPEPEEKIEVPKDWNGTIPKIEDMEEVEITALTVFEDHYFGRVEKGECFVVTNGGEPTGMVLMPYWMHQWVTRVLKRYSINGRNCDGSGS